MQQTTGNVVVYPWLTLNSDFSLNALISLPSNVFFTRCAGAERGGERWGKGRLKMSCYLKSLISWVIFLLKEKRQKWIISMWWLISIWLQLKQALRLLCYRAKLKFVEAVFDFFKGTNKELGLQRLCQRQHVIHFATIARLSECTCQSKQLTIRLAVCLQQYGGALMLNYIQYVQNISRIASCSFLAQILAFGFF